MAGERAYHDGATELVGEDLAIGYPTTDAPVVECDTVLLPAGEVTALVGPNGSGKSTLLRAMANQLSPERGRILLDGEDIQSFGSGELARRLGLLSPSRTSSTTVDTHTGGSSSPSPRRTERQSTGPSRWRVSNASATTRSEI